MRRSRWRRHCRLVPGTLLLACMLPSPWLAAQPAEGQTQRDWLLEQVRLGEAMNRETLVNDSVQRLLLLAPEDPEALSAAIRLALRWNDDERADALLAQLARLDPDGEALRRMRRLHSMMTGDGERTMQQITLLITAGRFEEAMQAYEDAFGPGEPADLDLALHYWQMRGELPGQQNITITALRALERAYPQSMRVSQLLVSHLSATGRTAELLAVLERMSRIEGGAEVAAELEFGYLADQPVSDVTVAAWQGWLRRYPGHQLSGNVTAILADQQRLTADPAWRAGQQGIRMLDSEQDPVGAEALMREAIAGYPDNGGYKGYLGLALYRQGREAEAIAMLQRAVAEETDEDYMSKWQDLLVVAEYWHLLHRADDAMLAGNHAEAERLYDDASSSAARDVNVWLRLATLALTREDPLLAEAHYRRAWQVDPASEGARDGLLRLYQGSLRDQALSLIAALPASQARQFADLRLLLTSEQRRAAGEAALERGDWASAAALLEEARAGMPDDPWLLYSLAQALEELGRGSDAEPLFVDLAGRAGSNPDVHYAHALYLSRIGRRYDALQSLTRIPAAEWTDGMRTYYEDLGSSISSFEATAMYEAGRTADAIAWLDAALQQQRRAGGIESSSEVLQLARWQYAEQQLAAAEASYRRVLELEPANAEARLNLVEILLEQARMPEATRLLTVAEPALSVDQFDERYRLATAWAAVGEQRRAIALLRALDRDWVDPPALFYRDLALLLEYEDSALALEYYAKAMAVEGLVDAGQAQQGDLLALSTASRERSEDDWLASSLRARSATLMQRLTPSVTVQRDLISRENGGTQGISDLGTLMAQVEIPVGTGRGYVRAERVDLAFGSFDPDPDGLHRQAFGSCSLLVGDAGCPVASPSVDGTSVLFGWQGERLEVDFGIAPQGFEMDNWLAGLSWSGAVGEVGWRLTGSRRPVVNSLLSYAGAVDPVTGIAWGGVQATGVTLGLSYDQGGPFGIWSSLGQHDLKGKNVLDNRHHHAMAGVYHRLIAEPDRQVRVGVNLLYWGYEHSVNTFTLGQGGYYSPQQFFSLSLPASYNWRGDDWTVTFSGNLNYSWVQTDASQLFPLQHLNQRLLDLNPDIEAADLLRQDPASRAQGFGVEAGIRVERRLDPQWVVGGGVTLRRSEDYAPNHALVYLRYNFAPWNGSMSLPLEPLQPYREFR